MASRYDRVKITWQDGTVTDREGPVCYEVFNSERLVFILADGERMLVPLTAVKRITFGCDRQMDFV